MKLRFSQRPVELHGLARGLNGSHGVKVVVNPNNRQLVMLFEQQQVRVSITCNGGSESEKRNTPMKAEADRFRGKAVILKSGCKARTAQ